VLLLGMVLSNAGQFGGKLVFNGTGLGERIGQRGGVLRLNAGQLTLGALAAYLPAADKRKRGQQHNGKGGEAGQGTCPNSPRMTGAAKRTARPQAIASTPNPTQTFTNRLVMLTTSE